MERRNAYSNQQPKNKLDHFENENIFAVSKPAQLSVKNSYYDKIYLIDYSRHTRNTFNLLIER